jgi:hypothetical protein
VEVALGKPMLEDVGKSGIAIAWEGPLGPGMAESGEHQEEWVDIIVGVELRPWPYRNWLTFWQEEELSWPDHLDAPRLDGRKLIFEAREDELEEAWAAVKARVEAANRLYREHFSPLDEPTSHQDEGPLTRLRESAQRRIDALE